MNPINIAILEDEPIIAEDLAFCLEDLGYKIAGLCHNGNDMLELVKSERPDIVLLDIEVDGDLDGVDVAMNIRKNYKLPLIFITSYADKKTIDRVKLTEPDGYLIKPFNELELKSNIELALYKYAHTQQAHTEEEESADFVLNDSFFVKTKGGLIKIEMDDIVRAEAYDNYAFIHTSGNRHLISSTLKKIEQKLPQSMFMRIHKSHIVNLKKITAISDLSLSLDDTQLPIGKTYKKDFMDKIKFL